MSPFVRAAFGVFAGVLLGSTPLGAQYRYRVVLLETAADTQSSEVEARLRGELTGAGFEVVALPIAPGDDVERRAEAAAGELHPAAVLYVVAPGPDADSEPSRSLVISDRLLRKNLVVRFRGDAQAPPNQAAQVAVQAVEILNADLAELSVTREAPAPAPVVRDTPPAREAPAHPEAPARRRAHAELQGGMGVLQGFHGTGAVWTPIVRAGVNAPESWLGGAPLMLSLLASVAAFGGEATVATSDGEAHLTQAEADAELVACFAPHAPVAPFVLVKSGAYTLRAEGAGAPVVHTERTWSGTSGVGAGIRVALGVRFALVLSGEVGFAWSRSIVRIANVPVASAGSPAALYGATAVGVF
jgi:hypothetical protein